MKEQILLEEQIQKIVGNPQLITYMKHDSNCLKIILQSRTLEEKSQLEGMKVQIESLGNCPIQVTLTHYSKQKQIIAVLSGKGGVGKSTISFFLAKTLVALGYKVGLLDADLSGPSIPIFLNTDQKPQLDPHTKKLFPLEHDKLRCMSLGFICPMDQATTWRGPMLHNVLKQMLYEVHWGEDLDYLIIDMPPGTGDIHLSLAELQKPSGALIVTTPSRLAVPEVKKTIDMLGKTKIPLLGIVENMSSFVCPCCQEDNLIFGKEKAFDNIIAKLPIDLELSRGQMTPMVSNIFIELVRVLKWI